VSRIEEIKARLNAATPGPWKARRGGDFQNITLHRGSLWIDVVDGSAQKPPRGEWIDSPDIDLIEAAPTDVAYLLAELRKRDAALANAKAEALEEAANAIDEDPYDDLDPFYVGWLKDRAEKIREGAK